MFKLSSQCAGPWDNRSAEIVIESLPKNSRLTPIKEPPRKRRQRNCYHSIFKKIKKKSWLVSWHRLPAFITISYRRFSFNFRTRAIFAKTIHLLFYIYCLPRSFFCKLTTTIFFTKHFLANWFSQKKKKTVLHAFRTNR